MFLRGRVCGGFSSVLLSISLLAPSALATTGEERSGARAAANQGLEAFNQQRWATGSINAAVLLTNGAFPASPMWLSVLFANETNKNGTYDEIFLSDGHIAIHYLIP